MCSCLEAIKGFTLLLGEGCLTFLVGCEKDAKAALAARLVRPHADDAQRGNQHDVVGHRGAEFIFQVLYRTEMKERRGEGNKRDDRSKEGSMNIGSERK